MSAEVGTEDEQGHMILPPRINLTSEKLERHGCFLLDDGQAQLIWLGRNTSPRLIQDLFDESGGYDALRGGKLLLPVTEHPFNIAVRGLLDYGRKVNQEATYPSLFVVKEDGDPALRLWFLSYLVEDRTGEVFSYPQWLAYLKERVNNGVY